MRYLILAALTCLLIACDAAKHDPTADAPPILREAVAEEVRLLGFALADRSGQYAGALAEWTRGMVEPGCSAEEVHSELFLFELGYLRGLVGDADADVEAAIAMQGPTAALVSLTVRAGGEVVESGAEAARERWALVDGRWRKVCPDA